MARKDKATDFMRLRTRREQTAIERYWYYMSDCE
jgi:hypothetical protein